MNVVDLQSEREINSLIDRLGSLISDDSNTVNRTIHALEGRLEMKSDETIMVSVRLPKDLVKWLDSYSRITAVNQEKRVTRSDVVLNFLELMRQVIKYREQHEFSGTHVEEIEKIIAIAKDQQGE